MPCTQNVPSNLVPSTFLKHFRVGRGCPWYGPSAPPVRHFAIGTLGYKTCLRAWYQVRFFGPIFGHSWGKRYRTRVAPGTVPLLNPEGTSRKACLENPEITTELIRPEVCTCNGNFIHIHGRIGICNKIFLPTFPQICFCNGD